MQPRKYDAATAEHLMRLAFPGYEDADIKPYVIKEDGVYLNEDFRNCLLGSGLDWVPAEEMDWNSALNPDIAPVLPIPFTAAELAAAMVDGIGIGIQEACTNFPASSVM